MFVHAILYGHSTNTRNCHSKICNAHPLAVAIRLCASSSTKSSYSVSCKCFVRHLDLFLGLVLVLVVINRPRTRNSCERSSLYPRLWTIETSTGCGVRCVSPCKRGRCAWRRIPMLLLRRVRRSRGDLTGRSGCKGRRQNVNVRICDLATRDWSNMVYSRACSKTNREKRVEHDPIGRTKPR